MVENNIKILYPELCQEWDYEKNKKKPEDYTRGSGVKVWWICKKNPCGCHKWITPIYSRTGKIPKGCPYCSNRQLCHHNNLKVLYPEICQEWDYDKNKKNPEDYSPHSGEKVWWICKKNPCDCHKWQTIINQRTSLNSGCPYCCNRKICSHNNLKILYPEICEEWDYDKNKKNPEDYSPHSGEKIWRICKKNPCRCHNWQATIDHMTEKNLRGCPYCSNRQLCPHNNLKVSYPEICQEWDYDKNKKNPEEYSPHSNVKVWWICTKFHNWNAIICSRTRKYPRGCPSCSNNGTSKQELKWLDSIEKENNIILLKHPNQKNIEGIGKVDGFHEETNTIYEYHGDYWHGNPLVFNLSDTNDTICKTFEELYNKTIERDNKIRQLGYNLVIKWETEE